MTLLQNQVQDTEYAEGDTIDIPDVDIKVLKEFVEYCYVREVSSKMVREYALETMVLAKRLKVLPLVNALIALLPLIVTLAYALDLIVKSSESDCEIREPIQKYCLDFIRINLENFNHDTLVERLPGNNMLLLLNATYPYP